MVMTERAEGGLVEDALEAFVAADGTTQKAGLAGLAQNGSDAAGRGERVGRAEAGEIACLGDEFGGEHGPHAGQAADEGRVRVVFEQRLQLAIEFAQAVAAGQGLASEFADQACGHALGRDGNGLLGRGGEGALGERLDLWQPAGSLQVAHEAFLAGSAQLGRGDKAGQQVQRPLGGQIEGALQAGKDADQKIVQTRQALGLPVDQIAAPADQQADLEVEFAGRLIGRRSLRARTWSAMVRASRGSDLFSPPLVPWRARLTARTEM